MKNVSFSLPQPCTLRGILFPFVKCSSTDINKIEVGASECYRGRSVGGVCVAEWSTAAVPEPSWELGMGLGLPS